MAYIDDCSSLKDCDGSSQCESSYYALPIIPFGKRLQIPIKISQEHLGQEQRPFHKSPEMRVRFHATAILTEDCTGCYYNGYQRQFLSIEVKRGCLLQSMSLIDDSELLRELKHVFMTDEPIKEPLFMKCVDVANVFLRVSSYKVLLLTDHERKVLQAVNGSEERYKFFKNTEHFVFVQSLCIGDRVLVTIQAKYHGKKSETLEVGRIKWIGGAVSRPGIFFDVILESADGNMDGSYHGHVLFNSPCSGEVIVSGESLKPVTKSDRKSNICSINIQNVEDNYFENQVIPSMGKAIDLRAFAYDENAENNKRSVYQVPIRLVSENRRNNNLSQASSACAIPVRNESSPDNSCNPNSMAYCEETPTHSPVAVCTVDSVNEYRSNDEYSAFDSSKRSISSETFSLSNQALSISNGDRIAWFDADGIPRRGSVKWIGRLCGHINIYVGVDFDEPVGGGTGRYEGVELFRTALNHAGFLPLVVCMKESDLDAKQSPEVKERPLRPHKLQSFSDSSISQSAKGEKSVHDDVPCFSFAAGSCVQVEYGGHCRFGVIKWFERLGDCGTVNAAVEIDGDIPPNWPILPDQSKRCSSAGQSADVVVQVPLSALQPDNRFATPIIGETEIGGKFGSIDSGIETNACLPTRTFDNLLGKMKGIQGYRNSCYLDATLYAMFVQCTAFDCILKKNDLIKCDQLRFELLKILTTEVVYPLRKFHFVRADHILNLRQHLERLLPEMGGLTCAEKDPEEFLAALFKDLLYVKPFLSMRNLIDNKIDLSYICPIITEDLWSHEQHLITSVQSLLERSLFASNIQFAADPKVLILQLPRYGQEKVFDRIIPQQQLDITHLVHGQRRPCALCGRIADLMCPECFLTKEVLLSEITYCGICYEKAHTGHDHRAQMLKFSPNTDNTLSLSDRTSSLPFTRRSHVPQRKLQLSSVLCIETSHYVSFVRSLSNKWVMFDSMADRVGLSDGYNVPQVKLCDKVASWLSETGWHKLYFHVSKERHLPIEVESDSSLVRLLNDCYICIYTNEERKSDAMNLATKLFA